MGFLGWTGWLRDNIEELKALKAITKDAEQLSILDRMIANAESKLKEAE